MLNIISICKKDENSYYHFDSICCMCRSVKQTWRIWEYVILLTKLNTDRLHTVRMYIIKCPLFWWRYVENQTWYCGARCGLVSFRIHRHKSTWWRHQMETFFRVTGHLCEEFTGHLCIPLTKASDAELRCFIWSTINNREAGDLKCHRAHYDVTVMNRAQRIYPILNRLKLTKVLRPGQNGRHFPDDILKWIFLNENI